MTKIHNQYGGTPWGTCHNGCFLFAPINAIEARLNLYYNQHLNYDLSEQEPMDCSPHPLIGNCWEGGSVNLVFYYIKYYGIVNESCFPYMFNDTLCTLKCSNPEHNIFIENYISSSHLPTENYLKSKLINSGPLATTDYGHAMCLVGYGIVESGMVLDTDNSYGSIVVENNSNYVGMTYWIQKNSRSAATGHNGYVYELSYDTIGFNRIRYAYELSGYIIDSINLNIQPRCVDADGDGYYNWGLGPKPSSCPSCANDTADADDSNPHLGPMDEFGTIDLVTTYSYNPTIINLNTTWNSLTKLCGDLIVQSNATLTLTDTLIMPYHSDIIVQNGGKFIIDGGYVENGNVIVKATSSLELKNNAIIIKDFNDEILIEIGGVFDSEVGEIKEE